MRTLCITRAVGILACLVSLFAAGAFSSSTNRRVADCDTTSNKDIEKRILTALRTFIPPIEGVPDEEGKKGTFSLKFKNGEVKVKGKADSSGDIRNIDLVADSDPCVSFVNIDGLSVKCDSAKALARAKEMLNSSLPCRLLPPPESSEKIKVSTKDEDILLEGVASSKKQKKGIRYIVEAADCVEEIRTKPLCTESA
jgi:hypothetical protein